MLTKIFVDDERECPDGMVLARTVHTAIYEIGVATGRKNSVILFLDHDLGMGETVMPLVERLAGLPDVLQSVLWVVVHSQNPVGAQNIVRAFSGTRLDGFVLVAPYGSKEYKEIIETVKNYD